MTVLERVLEKKTKEIDQHPVIANNPYTKWFKRGEATHDDVCDLIRQFSVFSNHFIVIQAWHLVNMAGAGEAEAEEGARSILVNELGVGIEAKTGHTDGKTFNHKNAHLNWLREIAKDLAMGSSEIGTWEIASTHTETFIQELINTYGSRDFNISSGASFAIETWAGFGIGKGEELESNNFWSELIAGFHLFNERVRIPQGLPPLSTGFFKYHFTLETGHVANVEEELRRICEHSDFNEEKWFEGAHRALKAIELFWMGLDNMRRFKKSRD